MCVCVCVCVCVRLLSTCYVSVLLCTTHLIVLFILFIYLGGGAYITDEKLPVSSSHGLF